MPGGIDNLRWTVYGKIAKIYKHNGTIISYTYDVAGNRISKTADSLTTWYVRDATGNVMSIYTRGDSTVNNGALSQTEVHLYGSSRLGMQTMNNNLELGDTTQEVNISGPGYGRNINFIRGKKLFEMRSIRSFQN